MIHTGVGRRDKVQTLTMQNEILKMQNEEQADELNTLAFWESIMEQNYDTRKLVQEFAKLR